MAKIGFGVRWTAEEGWSTKGDSVDPAELFDKAHAWLQRVEDALTGSTPDTEDPPPTAAEPPSSPPVQLPDNPLEEQIPALKIEFGGSGQPQRAALPATKFGGQPDWLEAPQWPVSRSLRTPMEFVAQIALHPDDLPWLTAPKVAYLFVTNDWDDPGGIAHWDPFAGENAVIVQPGTAPTWVDEFLSTPEGPTVGHEVQVGLTPRKDPELLELSQLGALRQQDPEAHEEYYQAVAYDKVGGTPDFFHGFEFPDFEALSVSRESSKSKTILMVTNADVSHLCLGDAGRGVAFLSPDQQQGAYLWFN